MFEESYSHDKFQPYCRCCGSRHVMTIDVAIVENTESGFSLRKNHLWHAIAILNEYELQEFILDAIPYINVEEDHEVEFGLHSYLTDSADYLPCQYRLVEEHGPVDFDKITAANENELLGERKFAFLRLWQSFDTKTKVSFLRRAAIELEKPEVPSVDIAKL